MCDNYPLLAHYCIRGMGANIHDPVTNYHYLTVVQLSIGQEQLCLHHHFNVAQYFFVIPDQSTWLLCLLINQFLSGG